MFLAIIGVYAIFVLIGFPLLVLACRTSDNISYRDLIDLAGWSLLGPFAWLMAGFVYIETIKDKHGDKIAIKKKD